MDYSPLLISLKTAVMATLIAFITGIFAADHVVKMKQFKGLIDGLLTLPLVLPPTVVGFFLLMIFGVNGFIGSPLWQYLHTKIIFTQTAAVIASTVVAFPMMYRTTRGAFEQLDRNLIYAGKTLGLSNTFIFWRIIVSNCRSGIAAGAVLTFARALGEFGATIMLAGNLPGKTRTISLAVYASLAAGDNTTAYQWVMVNLAISFIVLALMNFWNAKQEKSSNNCRIDCK